MFDERKRGKGRKKEGVEEGRRKEDRRKEGREKGRKGQNGQILKTQVKSSATEQLAGPEQYLNFFTLIYLDLVL